MQKNLLYINNHNILENMSIENFFCKDIYLTQLIKYPKNLLIVGGKYSGKTHITQIFKKSHNAFIFNEHDHNFRETIELNQERNIFIIDGLEKYLNLENDLLFNIFNILVFEKKKIIIITTSKSPKNLNIRLNDLISRLMSLEIYKIPNPDRKTIKKILEKRLNDYQLKVFKSSVNFLKKKINKFSEVEEIIQKIKNYSFEHNTTINIPVIKNFFK